MPKIEDGEKVNSSSKGEVRKEGRCGSDVSKKTEVLSRLESRAESAFQPSILPFLSPSFHRARTRWNPRAFETARKHSALRESFHSCSHQECVHLCTHACTQLDTVKTPR